MADCKSCAAPLPANTNRCKFCGIYNDMDLHGKHDFSIQIQESERICPHCDISLQTINLKQKGKFEIERCSSCFGLFFDPGEIEDFLETSVSGVFDTNFQLLEHINKERYQKPEKVKYIKWPVCRVLMNRVRYGHRSGVVIDRCISHGVWLNNGEITHLMEWKKAGGQILHEKRQNRVKQESRSNPAKVFESGSGKQYEIDRNLDFDLVDITELVFELIFKIFK
jgi:Zn-finger nucleic acid-binding protein